MPDHAPRGFAAFPWTHRPWAIQRPALHQLIRTSQDATAIHAAIEAGAAVAASGSKQRADTAAAVAVIPLVGPITPWPSYSFMSGYTDGLMGFRSAIAEAVADPNVKAIVLDVDSPGGLVDLIPETAAELRAAKETKPIYAVANTMAASAAYWLASQATELIVTPSGDVGSIGVYMLHEDWSAYNDRVGIDPTYIHAAPYKVEGNMDAPLGDDATAAMQADVDDIYEAFLADVAAGRGVSVDKVRADYGEGRTLNANRALAAGMVDRVATLEQVVQAAALSAAAGQGAAAQILGAAGSPAPQATIVDGRVFVDGKEIPVVATTPDPPADDPPAPIDVPTPKPEAESSVDRAAAARLIFG